jgi:hypothetical protein
LVQRSEGTKDNLGERGVDGRIILKRRCKKWDEGLFKLRTRFLRNVCVIIFVELYSYVGSTCTGLRDTDHAAYSVFAVLAQCHMYTAPAFFVQAGSMVEFNQAVCVRTARMYITKGYVI